MAKFTFEQITESLEHLGTVELVRLKSLIDREGKRRANKIIEEENGRKNSR